MAHNERIYDDATEPDDSMTAGDNNNTPTLTWDHEIVLTILHLLVTDQSFLVHNRNMLLPAYFPDDFGQWIVQRAYDHFEAHHVLLNHHMAMMDAQEHWRNDEQRYCEIEWELNKVFRWQARYSGYKGALQEKITSWCKRQATELFITKCRRLAGRQEKDGDIVFAKIEDEITKWRRTGETRGEPVDAANDAVKVLDAAYARDNRGTIPTGWASLDGPLGGGLRRGDVALAIGASGRGKSYLLLWVAAQAAKNGHKVLHVSVENPIELTLQRLAACITGIPINELPGKYRDPTTADTIRQYFGGGGQVKLVKYPAGAMSVADLRREVDAIADQSGWRPDLIVVDYLELLDARYARRDTRRYEADADLATDIKAWAEAADAVIWTASQANRSGYNANIISHDNIAGGVGKINAVDLCVSVNADDVEHGLGLARIYIAKSRRARDRGFIFCERDLSRATMIEIAEGDYQRRVTGGQRAKTEQTLNNIKRPGGQQ